MALLSETEGTAGGFKDVQFEVTGEDVYGTLKFESGVHRVQRVPATEASGRVHTSAATVAVMPEAEEIDFELKESDLKMETARKAVPRAIVHSTGSEIGIVAAGSSNGAVMEALDQLAARGIQADYMRIRAFPFGPDVEEFLAQHEVVYVIDQNRDGQLCTLLTIDTSVPKEKLRSVCHFGGMPLSAHHVVDGIVEASK